jgi:hypothetical protein
VGLCTTREWTAVGVRLAFALLCVAGLVFIAKRLLAEDDPLSTEAQGAAWAWALLLLTLTAPVLLPWYVIWTLPLVWLLPRVPRLVLVGTSTALLVAKAVEDPARYSDVHGLIVWFERIGNVAVVVAFLWLVVDLVRRARGGDPLEGDGSPPMLAQSRAGGLAVWPRHRA